jgi:pimeloyl-ACP methyl ester carboxylesterase
MGANVNICDEGSFFVGGALKVTNYISSTASTFPNTVVVGQMYVGFQIPSLYSGYPLIMISGGAHTGASLEATPKGEEGWAPYALRHGFPVFLVDQAGRGRSGFDSTQIAEGKARLKAGDLSGAGLIPDMLTLGPNSAWTAWFGHLVLPGTQTTTTDILTGVLEPHGAGFPNDPYFPQFPIHTSTPYIVPDNLVLTGTWLTTPPLGPTEFYQLDYYREMVPNSEQTLPASTCPTCTPQVLAPAIFAASQTWTTRDMAELVEQLGAIYGGAVVVTHSQSGPIGWHLVRELRQMGALNYLKGLVTVEGTSCSMPASGTTAADFDNVPVMVLMGSIGANIGPADCTASVNAIIARRLAGQGTAPVEYVKLGEEPNPANAWPTPLQRPVMQGITHMSMDGSNEGPEPCAAGVPSNECLGHSNLDVMDVILNWSQQNIQQLKHPVSCQQGQGH